jgi:Skp family chaperone for outer membrane proteins
MTMKKESKPNRQSSTMKSWGNRAVVAVAILIAAGSSLGQTQTQHLASAQVDEIVDHLQAAVQNYVFPDIATKLQEEIKEHRTQYRTISDSKLLAQQLTADMRTVGHDHHLAVVFGEELAVQKDLNPEEKQHAHDFDRASGCAELCLPRCCGEAG